MTVAPQGASGDLLDRAVAARRAGLATLSGSGAPHLVPVTFVVVGWRVHLVVDNKPKRGPTLQRMLNLERDPRVCLLIDHYAEDWTALWWVRLDGSAAVESDEDRRSAVVDAFAQKYRQYAAIPPSGPLATITVERASGWTYAGGRAVELDWGTGSPTKLW